MPADEQVASAEQAVEQAEQAVEQAEASGDPKAIDKAEARLRAAEDRLAALETSFTELRQHSEGRAAADHTHEIPPDLKALHDHMQDVESEEQAPQRKRHWLYRPLGRRAS